jgi:peptidoglycan/LPS O-acetylase OafA/YrhL
MTSQFLKKFQRVTSGGVFIPEIDGLRFLVISAVVLLHNSQYFIQKNTTFMKAEA